MRILCKVNVSLRLPHGRRQVAPCSVVALAVLLLASSTLGALEPPQSIAQHSHAAWSRENGQLSAGVRALAQTLDGRLWIGTDAGLLRFDGVQFQPWTPPSGYHLTGAYINALAAAPDGSLWIGTRDGLSHWKDSTLQNYPTSKGPSGPGVATVLVDRSGTVWVGTAGYQSGGLCRVEGNDLRCLGAADGPAGRGVLSLFEDRRGSVWAGGIGLSRSRPGIAGTESLADPRKAIVSIAEDGLEGIWVASGGLNRLVGGRLAPYPISVANQKLQPRVLLSDREGALWIGTQGQGLVRVYQGRTDRFTHADGLSSDIVYSLLQDREGNIWVGTEGGLDRFRQFAVTTISRLDGLSQDTVGSVLGAYDGGVWIGTAGGLDRIQDHTIVPYGKSSGLPSDVIAGIFEEQAGRLWASTAAGLAYFEGGRFRSLDLPLKQKISFVAAAEDRDRSVWFSMPERGLVELRDARLAEIVPWSQFANKQAWAIEPDRRNGGLWLGFEQGGVAYYKPGQPIRWYLASGPLASAAVTDLRVTRDGSLWIATQGGLGRLRNGNLDTLTIANGPQCNRVHSMLEDDNGALWLNTACGLARISAGDLSQWSGNPVGKVPVKVYDAGDGMRIRPTATGYFPHAAKSADGRLWFAVLDGVAVIDPQHIPENRLPPPVTIDAITAEHTTYAIGPNLRLPALTRELRIDYTALSFVAPNKVRFRYRLDGYDKQWKDDPGLRQAVYTNLPPRHYTFRVMACNNDGVWNETGASYDFSIAPAVYQTTWFLLLCTGAFGLLLWSLHRLRLRKMAAVLDLRYRERLAERTRIAREMHDSLLQNICGFALQLDGLAKMATIPVSARNHLREIRQEAELCLREAREFVWELRLPTLEERDLSDVLREAGEQIVDGRLVRFHTTVRGNPRPATATVQRHLLRIVQEATRNAVRYSRAKEIEINIVYLDTDAIRVQVRDDGCGFDLEQASLELGHWGLKTMRERALQIGGDLKISSTPGHGTELEIVAPMTGSPA